MSIYIVYPSDIWYQITGMRQGIVHPYIKSEEFFLSPDYQEKNSSIIYIQNNFKLEKETLLWQR